MRQFHGTERFNLAQMGTGNTMAVASLARLTGGTSNVAMNLPLGDHALTTPVWASVRNLEAVVFRLERRRGAPAADGTCLRSRFDTNTMRWRQRFP